MPKPLGVKITKYSLGTYEYQHLPWKIGTFFWTENFGLGSFEIWLLVRKPSVDEPFNLNLCLWNFGWLEPFDQKVVCRILLNFGVSTIDILQSTMASHIVATMVLRMISLKQSALMAQSGHLR